jgi:ankyrin repeat protein
LAFIEQLIGLGADLNYQHHAGFPSLIAALSLDRADKNGVLKLLLENGADVRQRGVNDWTPLHYAVVERDLEAVKILLAHGADPDLRTRIDHYISPIEDVESLGFTAAVELMLEAGSKNPGEVRRNVAPPAAMCTAAVNEKKATLARPRRLARPM